MVNIRLTFAKQGRAKYISHLDLNRCMQRAIKRARIPIWYTEGFNPHAYINFLLPLSLGFESICEPMDIRLLEEIPLEILCARLNQSLPEGLRILSAKPPVHKHTMIASAEYDITSTSPQADKFKAFLALDSITVEKKTKRKGINVVDLKPAIDVQSLDVDANTIALTLRLPSGVQESINPNLLFEAFRKHMQSEISVSRIIRKRILLADGKDYS